MKKKIDELIKKNPKLQKQQILNNRVNNHAFNSLTETGSVYLHIQDIETNPNQPRKHFDEAKLEALKKSIGEHGLLQPIAVYYKRSESSKATLIAGERRYRACKELGLQKIPVFVIMDKDKIAELSLVENIQREDLSTVERAEAVCRLKTEKGYSYRELAELINKSTDTVRLLERITKLPDHIKETGKQVNFSLRDLIKLDKISDPALRKTALKRMLTRYKKDPEETADREKLKRQAKKSLSPSTLKKKLSGINSDLKKINSYKDYLSLEKELDSLLYTLKNLQKTFRS